LKGRPAILALALCACSRASSAPSPSPSSSTSTSSSPSTSTSTSDAAADGGEPDLSAYAIAAPVGGKSVGHTSVVFKLKLEGGLEAAFKPQSHRGGHRYRGEVAAYRLARALDIDNVPPAMIRSFPRGALAAALGGEASDAGALFAKEAVAAAEGTVTGALVPWIPKLEFIALEAEPMSSAWRGWLAPDGGPDTSEAQALAPQVSSMIVFDYLTGNWDRWSGGQIGIDRLHQKLLYLDNDGAFFDPPPPAPLAAQLARLAKVARFSRAFVGAVRALDADAARSAFGEESPGVPLLSARVLAGVEQRRKAALGVIDAKIAQLGEGAVLAFP